MIRFLDLTTALRPSLLPDETLLFVQDAVGLYGGKAKLADYQNGQAYLTSHRACYVDNEQPRERAVAIDLRDVERSELYGRFLKSSPKVTLIPKATKFGPSRYGQNSSPKPGISGAAISPSSSPPVSQKPVLKDATWVCPICSFSNAVPPTFDPSLASANTPLPACGLCGIKPPLSHLLKAAISNLSGQQRANQPIGGDGPFIPPPRTTDGSPESSVREGGILCPRCTFRNHTSMNACEICGTSLAPLRSGTPANVSDSASRSSTPGMSNSSGVPSLDPSEEVKFSFRSGGEKTFHERLKAALTQRKWLVNSAPPVPRSESHSAPGGSSQHKSGQVGIAGLERRGVEMRRNNEVVIGNAFEDLAALMASAKEIIALAETLSKQKNGASGVGNGAQLPTTTDTDLLLSQLNLTTTKDMLSGSRSSGNNLYLTELCRSIAEFLTDDRRAILKNAGGVMSLVDLWAVFNRARGGVELVSPTDFAAATELFEKLSLPVTLRKFKSGLLAVQDRSRTDDKTVKAFLDWLQQLKNIPPEFDATWDWREWGRGITAQETAERFGWSIGVASEELEMAEERGALCRESSVEGVKFWQNYLGQAPVIDFESLAVEKRNLTIEENLRGVGLM